MGRVKGSGEGAGREKRKSLHARSRFARSAIPEEEWGTTRSLLWYRLRVPGYRPIPTQEVVNYPPGKAINATISVRTRTRSLPFSSNPKFPSFK